MNKRLSTSTNLMDRYLKTQGVITMTQCIDECYKAGYRILDMNLCDMSNPGMPLSLDNWEQWVDNVGNQAARLGIELTQSHSAFYNVVKRDVEDRDFREEMVRRSIIASSRFGVKWMVMHAGTVREEGYSWAESKEKNIAYFAKHLEMGKKYGVGIAIENLFDPKHDPRNTMRSYTGTLEELIDLVDSFNDPSVGVCWDFGHGNVASINAPDAIRKLGNRLKCTHINDNHGIWDEHLLPLYGDIAWEPIMRALSEINYQYDFAFEITPFVDKIPPHIRQNLLRHTYDVGMYLLSLAD